MPFALAVSVPSFFFICPCFRFTTLDTLSRTLVINMPYTVVVNGLLGGLGLLMRSVMIYHACCFCHLL